MMVISPVYLLVFAEGRCEQNVMICANERIIANFSPTMSAKNIFGKKIESNYSINGINREKLFQVQNSYKTGILLVYL